jgi:Domain of unknown function (DUF1906)
MTAQIIDCYSELSPGPIKANGFLGIARYISLQPGKCITPEEFHAYIAGGLTVVFVYEDNADDGLGGAPVGQEKGQVARQVLESCGIDPAACAVFFGYDFNAQPSQYQACLECQRAFVASSGCLNAMYAEGPLLRYAFPTYGWEPGSRDWNEGVAAGQLYQAQYSVPFEGTLIDIDNVLATDYGQWPRPTPPPQPKPQPSQEDLMNITYANGQWVCAGVSSEGHPYVFYASDPAGPWGICDVTDDIASELVKAGKPPTEYTVVA